MVLALAIKQEIITQEHQFKAFYAPWLLKQFPSLNSSAILTITFLIHDEYNLDDFLNKIFELDAM